MTIKFHPNITKLMLNKGILSSLTSTVGVTLFQGTQPTAADVTANWSTHSPNALVHWSGVTWTHPSSDATLGVTTFPSATATGSGIATWAIIWSTNITSIGGTLPHANFILVPASNTSGTGVIRVTNSNITSGQSVMLAEGTITGRVV
jgi:hypothetical protein